MFHLLMRPSNRVCDALGLADENERGMVRMLVNMLLTSLIAAALFTVAWAVVT